MTRAAVLGGKYGLLLVSRNYPLPEVLATDVLKDAEAEGADQKVPGLVLLLHEAAGRQAESVADGTGEQQHVQLWQWPLGDRGGQRRLEKQGEKQETSSETLQKKDISEFTVVEDQWSEGEEVDARLSDWLTDGLTVCLSWIFL